MCPETIKEMRQKTGLSQSQFADKFGIPVRTIQKWEIGASKPKPYLLHMMQEMLKQDELLSSQKASNNTVKKV